MEAFLADGGASKVHCRWKAAFVAVELTFVCGVRWLINRLKLGCFSRTDPNQRSLWKKNRKATTLIANKL